MVFHNKRAIRKKKRGQMRIGRVERVMRFKRKLLRAYSELLLPVYLFARSGVGITFRWERTYWPMIVYLNTPIMK